MIYAPHVLSKSPESPDLTAARARIAELEGCLTAIGDRLKRERETARSAGITVEAVRGVLTAYEGGETTLSRAVEHLRDLCLANTRIADLERWQKKARRALREYRARCVCSVVDQCPTCSAAEKLMQEATR